MLVLLAAVGCASKTPTIQTRPAAAPPDPWIITNLDPNSETPALLWNGLMGIRIDTAGRGQGNTFFDIANYQPRGEEKILGSPNPLDLEFFVEGVKLDPKEGSGFTSAYDMQTGQWIQSWSQDAGGKEVNILLDTRISTVDRLLTQRWTITPNRDAKMAVKTGQNLANHKTVSNSMATQTASAKFAAGKMTWIVDDTVENQTSGNWTANEWSGGVDSDPSLTYSRWIREASVPAGIEPEPPIWHTDIQIDGPVEDQQFVRSALFYLRSSIHPEGKMSVSPMGLSSEIYGGHVFWDADIWVFPALALIDPERAKAIPDYRLRRSYEYPGGINKDPAYGRNMREWLAHGRPIGNGNLGKPTEPLWHEGSELKVPWESSVTGKETVPGPSRFQDHITGSVHFMLRQADALGLVEPSHVTRFTWGATDFYLQRISKRPDGKFDLNGTMSPDENHIGDNDLYTNLVAQSVLDDGLWKMPKNQIPQLHLPKDPQTFLTYDNDGLRGYKQAAAVLSIYPLQYPPAEAQSRAMMERFADKVTKNGPAMSDSVHALIWARLGEKEKAYAAWHNSWKPFVKPPFLLFSEKRSSSRTYFTTGAAGSLNAVLYGFAGIRIDDKKAPGAQWSIALKNGKVLSIAPTLPREWKKLTLKNLTILGKKYTFEIENDRVKVS